ncbi:MAG: NHL repeat-containing protein [bacterium]|nr:NHL repeat-containing protein [bacterium]
MAELHNGRVLVYNLNLDNTFPDRVPDNVLGQANFYTNSESINQSTIQEPRSLAYDATGNRLFVVDGGNNRVLVFDVDSITNGENAVNVLGQADFISSASALTQSGMNYPEGLEYDATGNRLFVSGQYPSRVLVFDVASITNGENAVNVLGQTNFTSSSYGNTQSTLVSANGMAYDSLNSLLFLAERDGNRVKVFDVTSITNGENAVNVLGQTTFTGSNSANTQSGLNGPSDVAYDSVNSRLFVSESGGNRVKIFDVTSITNGENAVNVLGQADFISSASALTQSGMNYPTRITYDTTNNNLYVTDNGNNRVLVFNVKYIINGESAINVLGQSDFISDSYEVSQSSANYTSGLEYDVGNQRLFVSEDTSSIKIFSITPTAFISTVSGPSGSYTPGMSFDLTLTFSSAVTVTGTPTLLLETGEVNKLATYISGSGTATLAFRYNVQPGDSALRLDYTSLSALSLNGGTITTVSDSSEALIELPSPGAIGSLSAASVIVLEAHGAVAAPSTTLSINWTPPWLAPTIAAIVTPIMTPPTPPIVFNTNVCLFFPSTAPVLKLNIKHNAVLILQKILNCKGYTVAVTGPGSPEEETNKFGVLTIKQ